AAERLEIHRQQRHLLADVVVQFACETRALSLLRAQQASAEVTDALGVPLQFLLIPAHLLLGAFAARRLHEQTDNQCCLREQECARADDIPPVTLPHSWFAEQDLCAGGHPRFVDPPAPKLPPVHLYDIERYGLGRD